MALTKISSNEIQPAAITSDLISADVSLGVKISNVSIANSTYTVLDDTAVNVGGGYIVITGAGFNSGAQVIIGGTNATSVTRVSATELRAEVPAKSAATYNVYVVNTDGSTGIRVNGLTYSASPTWVTGSTLSNQALDTPFNITFDATGASSYSNTTALPAGTTLLSNGYFYGTVTGITEETLYSFTVRATDAESQDSDRTFSLTVETSTDIVAEVLIVAGGGGGGQSDGGSGGAAGGGAGGLLYYGSETPNSGNSVSFVLGSTYSITVGNGGGAGTSGSLSRILGPSPFNLTAVAGGRGASSGYGPETGGSGGGGAGSNLTGASGTSGQGNAGGTAVWASPNYGGGGGGGAGGAGVNSTSSVSGDGGVGLQYSISGSATYYAGGGGGDGRSDLGTGGLGGGGNARTSGTNGLGGGGGAGGEGNPAGSGGSGVVIIRYPDGKPSAASTTGSPTFTQSGGYKIYKFTGNGSITW